MKKLSQYVCEKIIDSLIDTLNESLEELTSATSQEAFDKTTDKLIDFFNKPYVQEFVNVRFNLNNQIETGYELQKNGLLINIEDSKDKIVKFIETSESWLMSSTNDNYVWFTAGLDALGIDFSKINEKEVLDSCNEFFN